MINIGDYNLLIIDRLTDFGYFLVDKERSKEVLLPNRYLTDNMNLNEFIEVFVYLDSEDRIVATTEDPKITVGEFAFLEVVSESSVGAFLDWGLPRDLLVPFSEMESSMKKGSKYPVYLYLDKLSNRLVASAKIFRFLLEVVPNQFEINEEVEIFLYEETEIGFKAVVNQKFRGMIFKNEIFSNVQIGEKGIAFVKEIREDGKLDLSLQKVGYEVIDSVSLKILNRLKDEGGFLPFNDNTIPETIKSEFNLSKKNFKKAIGKLYKDRKIMIEEKGIRLC